MSTFRPQGLAYALLFGTLGMAIGAGSVLGAVLSALLVKLLGSARAF